MNFKEIQELIRIVGESNLTTVEVENEGFRLLLKKEAEKIVIAEKYESGGPAGKQPAGHGYAVDTTMEKTQTPTAAGQANLPTRSTVNSPIVGTFYSTSSPGEAPFVQAGSKVSKGNTLCIIEAMKLMNEIEAEEDFEILEVLVKDGDMVEYGQPLFAIRK